MSFASLFKDYSRLTKEETQYAINPLTHVDFLLFHKIGKLARMMIASIHKVISMWLFYNSMVCPSFRQTTRASGTRVRKDSGVSPWMGIIP